jgi:glycosyltransferase involved in cell wall biosynthesis
MHNGIPYIAEALESVFAQTWQDFEIVIIDDGSTDGSADEIARRFRDPRLTLFRQPQQTLRVARPAAVSHARGEFIAFLDHDDVWLPQKLERQLDRARSSGAALLFSDSLIIDGNGKPLSAMSDQFAFASIDFAHPHLELLRRGNFVAYSTAMVRADTVRALGGFDRRYQYVSDYDLWLRIARSHPIAFIDAALAKYRIHDAQFTHRNADITLAEHESLLRPFTRTASYPRDVRVAVGDMLLGQHRLAFRQLLRRRCYLSALRAALGMLRHATRLRDSLRHRVAPRAAEAVVSSARYLLHRLRRRTRRALHGDATHIWFDGSALSATQNGYFNLAAEMIRSLASRGILHVTTDARGRAALIERIGDVASGIQFHPHGKRRAPRGRAPANRTEEILFWRGTFRWRDSHRVAIVQDLTTRIHPALHTAANVAEFDDYLAYAQRHAQTIATISTHSRNDIVERLAVCPESVSVIPVPIHPQYRSPLFDWSLAFPEPYVLCVGTIEPRKNLRRLVEAFRLATTDRVLVLVGPEGWDSEFLPQYRDSVHYLGFVELERLPSLYHFADAVIYPSLYEGFGLPLFEAMCSSTVVLASRTSSMPEVLGEDGILFDPYKTEEITSALKRALSMESEEASAYRLRCRKRGEQLLRNR